MTDKTQNETCGREQHDRHLCFLQYEGFHYKDPKAYKKLVQDAQFICRNCGRTAARAENLCDPVEL